MAKCLEDVLGRTGCTVYIGSGDALVFSGEQKIALERVELEVEEMAEHYKHRREMIRHKREFLGAGH